MGGAWAALLSGLTSTCGATAAYGSLSSRGAAFEAVTGGHGKRTIDLQRNFRVVLLALVNWGQSPCWYRHLGIRRRLTGTWSSVCAADGRRRKDEVHSAAKKPASWRCVTGDRRLPRRRRNDDLDGLAEGDILLSNDQRRRVRSSLPRWRDSLVVSVLDQRPRGRGF